MKKKQTNKRNKQTTIAKNTHWHLHRGPTAFSALDTPTADQLEISRFFYFLVLIVSLICSSKKTMVQSPESMLQCNERRKVKLIWNTIAVKCLWILHWLIWFSPVSKLCQNHKTFLIAHTCCQYNDSSDGQKYVSNKYCKLVKAIEDH